MKILLLGNDPTLAEQVLLLRGTLGAHTSVCPGPDQLTPLLTEDPPDLLLLDATAGLSLEDTLPQVRENAPHLPVLVLSGSDRPEDAVRAFHLGASDFLPRPVRQETLVDHVRLLQEARVPEGLAMEEEVGNPPELLFSRHPGMQALWEVVEKVKDTDLPLLITGESGTGKEMLARHIWSRSSRSSRPFLKVNCAAIPSELLESELFGFEKGAFTGAYKKKPGKFTAADGGTLLLDEISDLPYHLQSKLLHVLQDGSFSLLGSSRDVSVDVRVIAATNGVLEKAVEEGTFRSDLFFRLNVLQLKVPPLRERREDILPLARHFIARFTRQYDKPPLLLSRATEELLFAHPWPGNVRELENLMRRATVLGNESFVVQEMTSSPATPTPATPAALPARTGSVLPPPAGLGLKEISRRAALDAEREAIAKVLEAVHWNRKKAAQRLEVSYKTLLLKIKETGLNNA